MTYPKKVKSARLLAVFSMIFASSCSEGSKNQTPEQSALNVSANSVADSDAPIPQEATTRSETSKLSPKQMPSACKKAIAELMGKETSIMSGSVVSDSIARVSYKRPDDGKLFKYECKFDGNQIIWRGIDIDGYSKGPGRWRDTSSDEKISWKMSNGEVAVNVEY